MDLAEQITNLYRRVSPAAVNETISPESRAVIIRAYLLCRDSIARKIDISAVILTGAFDNLDIIQNTWQRTLVCKLISILRLLKGHEIAISQAPCPRPLPLP